MTKEIYDFIAALSWPLIALIGLVFVWRTDALGKLTKISAAAQDIRSSVAGLVEAEERLKATAGKLGETRDAIDEISTKVSELGDRLTDVVGNVASIRDQVERPEITAEQPLVSTASSSEQNKWLKQMDEVWQRVIQALRGRFEFVDGRSIGAEAYRLAHGNRKNRISYDLAEQIAALHSSMKSYKRRQATSSQWLTPIMRDEFILSCKSVQEKIVNS